MLLPVAGKFTYKYIVVDEHEAIVAEEADPRFMDVSESLKEGSILQICDAWQVRLPASISQGRAHVTEAMQINESAAFH